MTQQDFDFSGALPEPARSVTEEAIQRSDDNAAARWKEFADKCVLAVAKAKQEFTSDDVLEEMEKTENSPITHNLSAIGPAMKRAARDGAITSTNRVERSARAVKHGIRNTVWHSNIYWGR